MGRPVHVPGQTAGIAFNVRFGAMRRPQPCAASIEIREDRQKWYQGNGEVDLLLCEMPYPTFLIDLARVRYGSIAAIASKTAQMVEGKERVTDAGLAPVGKDAPGPVEEYIAWIDIVVNDSVWNFQIFETKARVAKNAPKLAQSVRFNLRDLCRCLSSHRLANVFDKLCQVFPQYMNSLIERSLHNELICRANRHLL